MKKTDYILPFLWVHGEEESVYREMIQAIKNANIHAFCVESRPHEAFLQDKWWADMDVIIDEAKKQDMRIYILDDKHFPTGYANGAAASAPNSLRRQSVFYKHINVKAGETVSFSIMEYCNLEPTYNQLGFMMNQYMKNDEMHFEDDRLLSATFYRESSYSVLDDRIQDGRISFTADADGEICLVYLTRNAGIHRNYINMLEEGSVRLLIDEVYEKHYAHYSAEFGKTIAGFFSDEPELGNSTYTNVRVDMGDDENLDFPWSESFEKSLEEYMGEEYKYVLPLLWKNNYDKDSISKVRYQFMTALTNQVSDCFSKQIGTWCREHGVEYIGHVIEDNNLHSKTGSSLGHYFKGLKYQTMAGIDDIGGQVLPYQEDTVTEEPARDGAFYHYCLGKLAVSLAQINPGMDGDSMCEIFGNYGWSEGVRLEKYLMDHFMVRGVNHFVPHAFTCSPYPDADCPPHFYAHGNNPQYRHFGELMAYGSRVCERLSGGKLDSPVAILYHAESEWCGERMLIQEPARELYDHQIDYSFLPAEVFEQRDFYNTKIGKNLYVNGNEYKLFVIAECDRIPASAAEGAVELLAKGGDVVFLNHLPEGLCEGGNLPEKLQDAKIIRLDQLAVYAQKCAAVHLKKAARRVRIAHYQGKQDVLFLVNEDASADKNEICVPGNWSGFAYDPYMDRCYEAKTVQNDGMTCIAYELEPQKSIMFIRDTACGSKEEMPKLPINRMKIEAFATSICRAIEYPQFKKGEADEDFSGFIRYEKTMQFEKMTRAVLVIEDAHEGVEVFVNGHSLGIQIVPNYVFDLSSELEDRENQIVIEVATTLQRERRKDPDMAAIYLGQEFIPAEPDPAGITGDVFLYYE